MEEDLAGAGTSFELPQRRAVSADGERGSGCARMVAAPASKLLAAITLGLTACMAYGMEPSFWLLPTCIGLLWGALFSAGFVLGSLGRGSLPLTTLVAGFAMLAVVALERTTDIAMSDCLLMVVCLVGAGWMTTVLDPVCRARSPANWKVTIWDLGFLTTLIACFCRTLPNLATTPTLLIAVLVSLACGVMHSWMASRWVWRDRWDFRALLALGVTLAIGWWGVLHFAPSQLSLFHSIQWFVSGPLNVIASQGVAVLLLLAVLRFEMRSLRFTSRPPHPLSH